MKFARDFDAFLASEVNLNQSRIDLLQQRVNTIEDFLAGHDTFQDSFLDLIPAGSWAQRTIIRPVCPNDEFDADVLLSMAEQPCWQPKDYIENLFAAFRSHGTYKGLAERKTRCVRINYAGDFHIDVVPYVERWGLHYITNRCEPEDVGRFELSNPEAFTAWVDERQHWTNGHFIKVVRLVKYLRDFKNTFTCKSIILMTLLGEQVSAAEETNTPEAYADVPSTLVTLMEKLADVLPASMPPVLDPGGTGDNFSERYKDEWDYENFRQCIIDYAQRMRAAYAETNRDASIKQWQSIFGEQFKPDVLERKAALVPYPASMRWEGEQFIDEPPYNFPLHLNPHYRARITGCVTGLATGGTTRSKGFRQFELSRHGNRVPKRRSLKFKISTSVPAPFKVYWKVRNGGTEAAQKNQLRGEISEDCGSLEKVEETSYAGYHFVEGYVVKGGVVVARDRQGVIVV